MSEKRRILIAGLGNPGNTYHRTRHNIGFMVIEEIADRFSVPMLEKKKLGALIGQGRIEETDVILLKPLMFMNLSGIPVQKTAAYFGITSTDMLIIHDDIDLAFGRIKFKEKGGDGGHKGIRSLMNVLGGDDFIRLRIGVGRPDDARISVSDYVLQHFAKEESEMLDCIITRSRYAVVTFLCKGTKEAMNEFNQKFYFKPSKGGNE
jgi:PTH1 family peptidyl-tRNA hydrolase